MSEIPNHALPSWSEDARDDALFHYTSAEGLIGIIQNEEIWSTAYYCTNDESELSAGKGILKPIFSNLTLDMIQKNDPLMRTFFERGVHPQRYSEQFEQTIISFMLNDISAYITCFCKPTTEEDFLHGLLSQWRAYGVDGGYALQFSRKKLLAAITEANNPTRLSCELQDVHYTANNRFKEEVLKHRDAFVRAYIDFLKFLAGPIGSNSDSVRSPIAGLWGGPVESLFDYLAHTKNRHFAEERECRLSLMEANSIDLKPLRTNYFNRRGHIVPYKKITREICPLVDCIEWIIIGPNPRMTPRFKSVVQLVQASGLKIAVRPSYIPFFRG
jgi:Protein of unknown function (DUF2971)